LSAQCFKALTRLPALSAGAAQLLGKLALRDHTQLAAIAPLHKMPLVEDSAQYPLVNSVVRYRFSALPAERRAVGHRRYTSSGDDTLAGASIFDSIREKRDAIARIAARHGATQVRLIGSVARGEARPDSDVDLLVTWNEGTSLLDQSALKLELESLLGRRVDIASDGWVKASIRESVYRDAIAL
jgi:predicted nucleotidyltransferase